MLKVLVVDDAKSIRQYVKIILEPLRVQMAGAKDGNEALEIAAKNQFDIILMDIEMPGISGIEAMQQLRSMKDYEHTPIIMMTALKQADLMSKAFASGATDYIAKPLSEEEVIARLKIRIEHRHLEQELGEAKDVAEKANKAKSEFIGHLAHELKTPLNAIMGFTQLIEMDSQDPEILEHCGYIKNACQHQQEMISEVTNLAKIEAGIIDIDLANVALDKVIKEAITLTRPLAEKFNVHINLPHRADFKITLHTDKKRLMQILLNLMSNAIKYNRPDGEVDLIIKMIAGQHIRIGVKDTGKGISQEDMPKLFETFNRLGAENSDIEGAGVGLPLVRKIIELMGGSLMVESKLGSGSTFWVDLKNTEIVN